MALMDPEEAHRTIMEVTGAMDARPKMGLEVSRGTALRKAAAEAARWDAQHVTVEAVIGADGGTWWQWTLRQLERTP